MKTSEVLLWVFLLIILLITTTISSFFKYKFRTEQLKYIQENTDDKTFTSYLLFSQLFGLIIFVILIGYLGYMSKNKY